MAYRTEKSKALFERAQACLVGGVSSSFHKAPWSEYPIYMEYGRGSRVYDVDGNAYIDYLNAFGPLILGYVPEGVTPAVEAQLRRGTLTAAPSEALLNLCERLIAHIPCAEKVYGFMCSGSEANMQAVRVARAYTGKTKIVKIEGCYHGCTDEEKVSVEAEEEGFLGPRENPSRIRHIKGQRAPDDLIIAHFNDLKYMEALLKARGGEIACVILEPIMANAEPVYPQPGFLEGLRELSARYGVVLIYDEIITGFRLRLGGAQEYFGVKPDLATYGKAMAAGYPISCVVGREEILAAATAPSGTFAANAMCVAAANAAIAELEAPGFYDSLEAVSKSLAGGVDRICAKYGIPCVTRAIGGLWTMVFGADEAIIDYRDHYRKADKGLYRKLVQGCMENGIRLNPWRGRNYTSSAVTEEDVRYTLGIFDMLLGKIAGGEL
jgi:glutamate-1-semialdehyde 2,1-aminomutase